MAIDTEWGARSGKKREKGSEFIQPLNQFLGVTKFLISFLQDIGSKLTLLVNFETTNCSGFCKFSDQIPKIMKDNPSKTFSIFPIIDPIS